MTITQQLSAAALVLGLSVGTVLADDNAPKLGGPLNELSAEEKEAGWKLLFDGKTTEGWRNFRSDSIRDGWQVKDGALCRVAGGAGDIVTTDQYEWYELSIEYNISPGGNSGIMYHVTEEMNTPWKTGPEIQILCNEKGRDPQKSGWLYQMYAPEVDTTRPAGEWNHLRILLTPERCAHYMNGTLYVEYVKHSDDWNERVAKSKFSAFPQFGKANKGYIALQDHGDAVCYRNIKIRPIKVEAE